MGGSAAVPASTQVLDASQEGVAGASCFSGDEQPKNQSTPPQHTRNVSDEEPDRDAMAGMITRPV